MPSSKICPGRPEPTPVPKTVECVEKATDEVISRLKAASPEYQQLYAAHLPKAARTPVPKPLNAEQKECIRQSVEQSLGELLAKTPDDPLLQQAVKDFCR